MLIGTLTGDEFTDLTTQEHDEALALYAEAVRGQARRLHGLAPGTPAHEQCLDKLARLLTLRQVHQVRRRELEDDELFATTHLASTQYLNNERNPHHVS